MFFFLKIKSQKEGQSQSPFLDAVAADIVKRCIQAQARWAAYMQRKTDRLSAKAKKYSLALFCLLSLGCSLYLIVESITGNAKKDFDVAPIRMPVHSTQTGEENTRSYQLITKEDGEKMKQFRQYMDSLSKTASGIRKRDSLLSKRPHFIDSVRALENFYRLQNLKSK